MSIFVIFHGFLLFAGFLIQISLLKSAVIQLVEHKTGDQLGLLVRDSPPGKSLSCVLEQDKFIC